MNPSPVTERLQMLRGLLIALANFLRENKEVISLDECRGCYDTLPNTERQYIGWLPQTLEHLLGKKRDENGEGDEEDEQIREENEDEVGSANGGDRHAERAGGEEDNSSDEDEGRAMEEDEAHMERMSSWDKRRRFPSLTKIKIPPSLHTILENCKVEKGSGPLFKALSQGCLPTSGGLVAAYLKIRQCEEIGDIVKIHRRFDLRNFFLLATEYGYCSENGFVWGAANKLAREIKAQHPLSGDHDEIRKNLRSDIELGRGYNAWVLELGHPGYLIALPLEISETEYTHRGLRKYIPEVSNSLRGLKIENIVRKWELERLGEDISSKLRERFRPLEMYKKRNASQNGHKSSAKRRRQGVQKYQLRTLHPPAHDGETLSTEDNHNQHLPEEPIHRPSRTTNCSHNAVLTTAQHERAASPNLPSSTEARPSTCNVIPRTAVTGAHLPYEPTVLQPPVLQEIPEGISFQLAQPQSDTHGSYNQGPRNVLSSTLVQGGWANTLMFDPELSGQGDWANILMFDPELSGQGDWASTLMFDPELSGQGDCQHAYIQRCPGRVTGFLS
ncbi:hypothetical protein MaudCBS49596_000867 [Microsporum audouinii]